MDVFWHDGHTFGVDGAQVGVFEKTNQVSFGGFLQGQDGRALETQVGFEVLGDFTNQTLEGKFADQEFRGFLVSADFTKGNSTGAVSVGFFDTAGGRGGFTGGFGGQLFAGCFTTGGFTGCLLGAGCANKKNDTREVNKW